VDDLTIETPRGKVTIARDVVADVAADAAARCYGVVALSSGSRVGRMLRREAVGVSGGPDRLTLALHVVVEHGLNLAEVGETLRRQVAYEVERITGFRVAAIEVVIQNVRESA
jgi:uncharacterized alkaline shock family protein YloU